jgi:hypothetical protein
MLIDRDNPTCSIPLQNNIKSLVELADNGFVLRGVAEAVPCDQRECRRENSEFAVSGGHEDLPERGRMVKLYGRMVIATPFLIV